MSLQVPEKLEAEIDAIVARYPQKRSASMMLLHALQEEFGFVSNEAVEWIAAKLGLQPINVYELVSFYPMYRSQPSGKVQIKICRTLSCELAGSHKLAEHIRAKVGVKEVDGTSADGKFTVGWLECIADCHRGPCMMVNNELFDEVTPQKADQILASLPNEPAFPKSWPPHPKERRLVGVNFDKADYSPDMACYLKHGGYADLKKALAIKPEAIIEEVKKSGLRGRGGAGFSAGVKWSLVDRKSGKPIYLICNADESEPGTFKDRQILHKDPHQLLEGLVIACYANGVKHAFIYIRGEFPKAAKIMEQAIDEARTKNFVGKNILKSGYDLEVTIHRGAGAYICGEETGLIESLEGKRAYPRFKPPYFPAVLGLYMCPTVVNNVETLCHVKHVVAMGADAYAKIGTPNNTGTRFVCVSGHVNKPGYFEIEVGKVTIGELINGLCGGLRSGRKLKAVIPGGSSSKILRADEKFKIKGKAADGSPTEKEIGTLDIPYDFDTLGACGTMSGSGAVIVLDDSTDIVAALDNIEEFYAHESCGQCTPCREGVLWVSKILHRLSHGQGRPEDPAMLKNIADNAVGKTICPFGEAFGWPVQSYTAKFKEEFAAKCASKSTEPATEVARV